MKKTFKKLSKLLLIAIIAVIMTSCSIISNISSNLVDIEATYENEDIGEIYCAPIESEHIAYFHNSIGYIDNEILIAVDPNTDFSLIDKLAHKYGGEISGRIEKTGDYQIKFKKVYSDSDITSLINSISAEEIIVSAYCNYVTNISSDTINYGDKWKRDLKDVADCKGKSWGVEAINAPAAWSLLESNPEKVNKNLRIGLIDNGFDLEHEDLGFAYKFSNYNVSVKQNGEASHGTHVAGTMAASSDNKKGICGVYPYGNGNLYGISYNGITGYAENKTSLMMEKIALAELILRNVKVINASYGNSFTLLSNDFERPIYIPWDVYIQYCDSDNEAKKHIDEASDILASYLQSMINIGYDFVIVNSAGNESHKQYRTSEEDVFSVSSVDARYNTLYSAISPQKYPDVYNRIIVVGSVNENYMISNFSCVGNRVDVFAPGEKIYSTMANNKYGNTYKEQDGKKGTWDGTSMAAPHVAGVAAMVWAANSNLTGDMVKMVLCGTATVKDKDVKIVNAERAVKFVLDKDLSMLKDQINDSESLGSIMSYVVTADASEERIPNALVEAINVSTNKVFTTKTDSEGHYEMFLDAGEYSISIQADEYELYTYSEYIQCTAQQVNYIDWAKLIKSEHTDTFVPNGEYIKVDFDDDGKNEIFAIEDITMLKHKLWYYDDDLTKTQIDEIDDSAICKLGIISSEYGNHVYLNRYQDEVCPLDNIHFSIYINKNNKPYCCNSGRGPLEYNNSNEIIWHFYGHDKDGFLVGIDYKLEYNVSKNEYDYFNLSAIKVTQSDLDNMAQEIYDLSYTVFKDLSKSDQSTFYLGAARLGSILKYGGYSINNFKSDFLKKYALEDWVHIDIKFNFYENNSDVYFYIEYASIEFDDNQNYVNENIGAKGIYYNPQFSEKQAVSNNSDNFLSSYMSEEQFTQYCANAKNVHTASTAACAQAYVDSKLYEKLYEIPTGWVDGEDALLTKNGKTLDLTTGLGSDFKGYMYVHIDEYYAVTCAIWSSNPIPQECKALLIKKEEYEGLTKEEALKYGVGCYPMPY